MNNANNPDLYLDNQPAELVQDALLDVLRSVVCSADTLEAAEEEAAERTIIVTRLEDGPWLTIFDDAPPQEVHPLAMEITERIGSPMVHLAVHDGEVLILALFRDGECVEQLSVELFDDPRRFPVSKDIGQWQRLLPQGVPPSAVARALAESADNLAPLNRLADPNLGRTS